MGAAADPLGNGLPTGQTKGPEGDFLAPNVLYGAARQAGFTTMQAITAAMIAYAESGGNASALADTRFQTSFASGIGPEFSVGLWQINLYVHTLGEVGVSTYIDLYDPLKNAQAAYRLFKEQGFNAWSTYKTGAYSRVSTSVQNQIRQAATQAVLPAVGPNASVNGLPGNDAAGTENDANKVKVTLGTTLAELVLIAIPIGLSAPALAGLLGAAGFAEGATVEAVEGAAAKTGVGALGADASDAAKSKFISAAKQAGLLEAVGLAGSIAVVAWLQHNWQPTIYLLIGVVILGIAVLKIASSTTGGLAPLAALAA